MIKMKSEFSRNVLVLMSGTMVAQALPLTTQKENTNR